MPSPNSYSTGSVFTVKPKWSQPVRLHEVEAGAGDAPAHEPWFHLAVVQFEDDGRATNPAQTQDAIALIRSARNAFPDGAVVVVFIHGWHHNAAWNRSPSTPATDFDGDEHFHAFRLVLESLAIREIERRDHRRVVGILLGWNGIPATVVRRAVSGVPGVRHTSFRTRYAVAERIGAEAAFQDTLRSVITTTKEPLPGGNGRESPLIMMGHSMGALMLESGLLALLKDQTRPLIGQALGSGAVQLKSSQGLVSFPNLILALNSAADSNIAKEIVQVFEWHKLEKVASADDISFSPPIIMSVTATDDTDTRDMWRLAQGLYAPWRRTDGHDDALITHDFLLTARNSICRKQPDVRDFGQNWHCLRRPSPLSTASPAIPIDLPTAERKGVDDAFVPHARYTITPRVPTRDAKLMWVFQVPPAIMKNHNDVFNDQARSLILGLIQISGAVASIAEDWAHSFEPE
jgi:hypothetical protein